MSSFEQAVEALERLRLPCDLSFRHDGNALAVTVQPAVEDSERGLEGRIWLISTAGEAAQLTHGPGSDALPRFSPLDERLAFASDRMTTGRMSLFILAPRAEPRPIGEITGSVEEVKWTADATALLVLAADRGLDAAPTHGATRLWWGDKADPDVLRPGGHLAVFWNRGRNDPDIGAALDAVYERLAPSLATPAKELRPGIKASDERAEVFRQGAQFSDMQTRTFDWETSYDRAEWIDFISSHSDHVVLPEAQRAALLEAIGDVVDDFGGTVAYHFSTLLLFGTRRG